MRVVIVDSDLKAGRATAAQVEKVYAAADVLLYDAVDAALTGIETHAPDVVIVAPNVGDGDGDGPTFVQRAVAAQAEPAHQGPKYVGLVPAPDPEWSTRYIDAGATLVVAAPIDALGVQTAMRHRAGGVPA